MPDRFTPNEPANVSFRCTPVVRLPESSSSQDAVDPKPTSGASAMSAVLSYARPDRSILSIDTKLLSGNLIKSLSRYLT